LPRLNKAPGIFRPDLILLDAAMPKRGGDEIAAQVHGDADLQNVPIIFLTALVASSGLRTDGHRFLAKPINIQELIKAIEENLLARPPS
jgi:two-component system sensor histidine kinase/response regulator